MESPDPLADVVEIITAAFQPLAAFVGKALSSRKGDMVLSKAGM